MLRGVNKQIMEIRCPKDERFEKILLFVNSENCPDGQGDTDEKAKLVAKRFLDSHGVGRRRGRIRLGGNRLAAAAVFAVIAAAAVYAAVRFV